MFEQLLNQYKPRQLSMEQQQYGRIMPSNQFLIPAIVSLITSLTVSLCMLVSKMLFQCLTVKKPERPLRKRERVNQEPFPRSPLAGRSGRR